MTLPGLLLTSILSVSHAPGWSDPVISIAEPSINAGAQRKDIEVTDGNHIHQIWDTYQSLTRIGYNVVLPDGTILSPDTMISRNVFSGYLSSALIGTDFFGVWRENSPIWFAVNDHTGEPEIPATLFTSTPWSWWWYIAADGDSLGRVHMTYDTPGGIWYSIMIPGQPPVEVSRDTIPQSMGYSLLDVDGDRVHILYKSSADWMPRYVQYDLDGNQTLRPIEFADPTGQQVNNWWSLCSDYQGNACVFEMELIGTGVYLVFYRIDRTTGELLVDSRIIYSPSYPSSVFNPVVTQGPWAGSLHVVWLEADDDYGYDRLIRHAIIDLEGDFIVEPYTAYDYTDEEPENISYMVATSNEAGDLLVAYSEGDPSLPGYWIRLGWLDHNYLGVEDQEGGEGAAPLSMTPSCNPFTSSVTIACEGECLPGQLMVYDISGRLIRSLSDRQGPSFLWDGCDASGDEVPAGTYSIHGAVDGLVSSIRIVRL